MAGDHKCPVCQSTFTRPQHVARHMRSHTGDRPYKCQHCGDAFARSDLLSRHVNKCHSVEKAAAQAAAQAAGLPPPGKGRKGRGNVSSKAPCDQCTLAKLACNSGEPCSKCVTKSIKCTYNQMNFAKAQQLPSLTLTQTSLARPRGSMDSASSASSSSFAPFDYYNPVVPSSMLPSMSQNSTMTDPLFSSLSSSLPPQFTFPPSLYGGNTMDSPTHTTNALGLTNDTHSTDASSPVNYSLGSYSNAINMPRDTQPELLRRAVANDRATTLPSSNPYQDTHAPFASQASTAGRHSRPHHLSLTQLTTSNQSSPQAGQQNFSPGIQDLGQHANYNLPNDGRPHTAGEGGFSSAFGLMSLDDPAVLAGFATHAPFFDAAGQNFDTKGGQGSGAWEGILQDRDRFRYEPPREDQPYSDARAFWQSFMRTPSDHTIKKKNSDGYIGVSYANSNQSGGTTASWEHPGMPARRLSRRASLPPTKTPPALVDDNNYSLQAAYDRERQNGGIQLPPPVPAVGNRPDELRAYEQAILARGPPEFKVDPSNLAPKRSRTLGHTYAHQNQEHDARGRPVLPPGRNAPFIGPAQSSDSSSNSSPVHQPNTLQNHEGSGGQQQQQQQHQQHETKQSHQQPPSARARPPIPQAWDSPAVVHPQASRPAPKRNASQTLEQELQKTHRPAGASDVTNGGGPHSDEESHYSSSRPGTANSQVAPHISYATGVNQTFTHHLPPSVSRNSRHLMHGHGGYDMPVQSTAFVGASTNDVA